MTVLPGADLAPSTVAAELVSLRRLAVDGLRLMYRPEHGLFAFRIRPAGRRESSEAVTPGALRLEGSSIRYTAISLIGLAGEAEDTQRSVLAGGEAREVCARLVDTAAGLENLGDVALTLWAAHATGAASRAAVTKRLLALRPDTGAHPTVEVAWALAALCADVDAPVESLRRALAHRLIAACDTRSGMFPHRLGEPGGLRGHVCCFADLVYPVHALARYAEVFGDTGAGDVALRCARIICAAQGLHGQWWWHYDRRTGAVVERYPVYAVHQDAMAPMALLVVQRATRVDFRPPIERGLAWLLRSPELSGGTLIDWLAGIIWRKVARREPGKLSRWAQAAASRAHPALRAPGLDVLFPARAIDVEDRPYHLGWLLHAWPESRVSEWTRSVAAR
jgi:hypothetical protein